MHDARPVSPAAQPKRCNASVGCTGTESSGVVQLRKMISVLYRHRRHRSFALVNPNEAKHVALAERSTSRAR